MLSRTPTIINLFAVVACNDFLYNGVDKNVYYPCTFVFR